MDAADPGRRDCVATSAKGRADRVAVSAPAIGFAGVTIGFRPRLWPTLLAIPIVLVCLGLSAWQVQRLYWKRDLIAQRQAAVNAPPITPPRTAEEARQMEFRHVAIDGTF